MAKTSNVQTTETTTKPKKEKKWGVVRFLNDYPQEQWIEVLMKKNYPAEFHTVSEWLALVEYTRTKPVK